MTHVLSERNINKGKVVGYGRVSTDSQTANGPSKVEQNRIISEEREEGLVFAPLIRVSTESQARRGESLKTQKKELEAAIHRLNGTVYHWYNGQEHATANHERKILNNLMQDATEKKFNSVIVTDLSRWSRDNAQSKEYLKVLQKNSIRFFVLTTEYKYTDSTDSFKLGVLVEVAEYHAKLMAEKSINNRIERARKGYPSSGKSPWGRKFNKETEKWEIIPGAEEKIQEIAKQYLEESVKFQVLAKKYGMSPAYLHKVLTKRCGDTWEVKFDIKRFDIYEKISIPVPRLLSELTIRAIRKKCEARRTYEHAGYKYKYLLNRMIYDKETGYALTGTSNNRGNRYYKPYRGRLDRYMVNADVLEETIMDTLFEALGSNDALFAAVFEGNPGMKNAEDFKDKIALLKKERGRVEKQIFNISEAVTNFSGDDIKFFIEKQLSTLTNLEKQRSDLDFKIDAMTNQQRISPTKKEVESKREKMHRDIARMTESIDFRGGGGFQDMSFEDKQKILKLVFGGKDETGKRYGIYIKPLKGSPKQYSFEAYGRLGNVYGYLESRTGEHDSEDIHRSIRNSEDEYLLEEISTIVKSSGLQAYQHLYKGESTYPNY